MDKKYVNTIRWNIYSKQDVSEGISGIYVEPVVLEKPLESKQKILMKIKIYGNSWEILNLPQKIYQQYPVILNDKPKTIIYGEYDPFTGDCDYIISAKKPVNINVGKIALSMISLHPVAIAHKVKRLAGRPGIYISSVYCDAKKTVDIKKLYKKPDLKKDQDFLDAFTSEQRRKGVWQYTILGLLFLIAASGFYIYLYYFNSSYGYLVVGFYFLLFLAVWHRRYMLKYQKRIPFKYFLWKFITIKGF